MDVWVATYHNASGADFAAFSSEERALAWRDEIARANWAAAFPDEEMPATDIGHAYFSGVHYTDDRAEERFTVERQALDFPPALG